jgi:hypothetical protein
VDFFVLLVLLGAPHALLVHIAHLVHQTNDCAPEIHIIRLENKRTYLHANRAQGGRNVWKELLILLPALADIIALPV